MTNFTKNDLIAHVASETGISKTKARVAVDATLEGIASLDDSAPLILKGFGTFRRKTRAARDCSLTNQSLPSFDTLTFKASKALRKEV